MAGDDLTTLAAACLRVHGLTDPQGFVSNGEWRRAVEALDAALAPYRRTSASPAPAPEADYRTLPCGCIRCVCMGPEPKCYGCGSREAPGCREDRLAGKGWPRHAAPSAPAPEAKRCTICGGPGGYVEVDGLSVPRCCVPAPRPPHLAAAAPSPRSSAAPEPAQSQATTQLSQGATAGSGISAPTVSAARCDGNRAESATKEGPR